MRVNSTNAALVATIFTALSDERFSMRTLKGIKKGTNFTDQQVAQAVIDMRLPVAHRNVDSAPLVVRPVDRAKLIQLRDKANAILNGGEEFDVDFGPALIEDDVIEGEALEVAALLPAPRRLLN